MNEPFSTLVYFCRAPSGRTKTLKEQFRFERDTAHANHLLPVEFVNNRQGPKNASVQYQEYKELPCEHSGTSANSLASKTLIRLRWRKGLISDKLSPSRDFFLILDKTGLFFRVFNFLEFLPMLRMIVRNSHVQNVFFGVSNMMKLKALNLLVKICFHK